MQATIYTKPDCPYCVNAKAFMTGLDISYEEFVVGEDVEFDTVKSLAPKEIRTVPQIWVDKKYVGGYDDLVEWAINE